MPTKPVKALNKLSANAFYGKTVKMRRLISIVMSRAYVLSVCLHNSKTTWPKLTKFWYMLAELQYVMCLQF